MVAMESDDISIAEKEQNFKIFNELMGNKRITSIAGWMYGFICFLEQLVKQHPVKLSLASFLISFSCLVIANNEFTRALAIAAFGSIFLALTYALGQAKYHKDLFEDRLAIFNVIDGVMRDWAGNLKASREMVGILDNIMRKSYCIFSQQTYQFIKKFRMSIIILAYCIESAPDRKEVMEARNFLGTLVDNENLLRMFPELKIDSY